MLLRSKIYDFLAPKNKCHPHLKSHRVKSSTTNRIDDNNSKYYFPHEAIRILFFSHFVLLLVKAAITQHCSQKVNMILFSLVIEQRINLMLERTI